jgi:hypothetical protein
MRRLALLFVAAAALAVGCTGHTAPRARPAPTGGSTPALATGRVPLALVAYCGAGSRVCPATLLRRVNQDYRQRKRYLVATPTTVLVFGFGCGGNFPAPIGDAIVTDNTLSWTIRRSGGVGLDCEGSILAFVRFARPLFDMRTAMEVRANDRLRKRVFHTRAWPAPDLAPWADGRGMIPFQPNRNSSM